jgi:hypothetical protein
MHVHCDCQSKLEIYIFFCIRFCTNSLGALMSAAIVKTMTFGQSKLEIYVFFYIRFCTNSLGALMSLQ